MSKIRLARTASIKASLGSVAFDTLGWEILVWLSSIRYQCECHRMLMIKGAPTVST